MRRTQKGGALAIAIIVIIAILIILLIAKCTSDAIDKKWGPPRVVLVTMKRPPIDLAPGESFQANVRVLFSRKFKKQTKIKLQIWEDDGLGGDDEISAEKEVTMNPGDHAIRVPIQVGCNLAGHLEGDSGTPDDDDGDRIYEVYAYVVDDGNGMATEDDDVTIVHCLDSDEPDDSEEETNDSD